MAAAVIAHWVSSQDAGCAESASRACHRGHSTAQAAAGAKQPTSARDNRSRAAGTAGPHTCASATAPQESPKAQEAAKHGQH